MRRQPGSLIFGLAVGMVFAVSAYRMVTTPDARSERRVEEAVVLESRMYLSRRLQIDDLEIVDPLAPRRSAGKSYVYPAEGGWEVSGYYRRDGRDVWHAFLMKLDTDRQLLHLKVQDDDAELAILAERDDTFDVLR